MNPQRTTEMQVYSDPRDLEKFLEKAKGKIAMALPKHLNPDRMLRLALTAFSTTPKLRECSGMSILSSLVVASQLGLEPNVAGQGYLIPYKQTCTFVPGWQGLVSLLNNSGRATAWTGCVFEGDDFEFELGSRPICRHIPGENFGDPEKMTWVYACGKVNGSEQPVIEAWPMKRVWRHRDRFNKVGNAHYSFQHPEMYARKVVLLQVLKYMPRSVELQNALTAANASDGGRVVTVESGVVIEGAEIADANGAPQFEAPKQVENGAKDAQGPRSAIADLMRRDGVDNDALLFFLRRNDEGDYKSFEEVPDKVLASLIGGWDGIKSSMR